MNPIARVWRGDELRRTRFHTVAGRLCLDPQQMTWALLTTVLRHATGRLLDLPWLTFPAIDFLKRLPRDLIIFEYGCGMSTSWYGRRFRQIHGVDDNPEWFRRVRAAVAGLTNVQISLETAAQRYITAIDRTPHERFDMVVIDGSHRLHCLRQALPRLRAGGVLVVDNTDVEPELVEEVRAHPTRESIDSPATGLAPSIPGRRGSGSCSCDGCEGARAEWPCEPAHIDTRESVRNRGGRPMPPGAIGCHERGAGGQSEFLRRRCLPPGRAKWRRAAGSL